MGDPVATGCVGGDLVDVSPRAKGGRGLSEERNCDGMELIVQSRLARLIKLGVVKPIIESSPQGPRRGLALFDGQKPGFCA